MFWNVSNFPFTVSYALSVNFLHSYSANMCVHINSGLMCFFIFLCASMGSDLFKIQLKSYSHWSQQFPWLILGHGNTHTHTLLYSRTNKLFNISATNNWAAYVDKKKKKWCTSSLICFFCFYPVPPSSCLVPNNTYYPTSERWIFSSSSCDSLSTHSLSTCSEFWQLKFKTGYEMPLLPLILTWDKTKEAKICDLPNFHFTLCKPKGGQALIGPLCRGLSGPDKVGEISYTPLQCRNNA